MGAGEMVAATVAGAGGFEAVGDAVIGRGKVDRTGGSIEGISIEEVGVQFLRHLENPFKELDHSHVRHRSHFDGLFAFSTPQ